MQKLISMSCPNCGGRVEAAPASTQFTCAYCGTKWNIQRTSLDDFPRAPADRVASEIAIKRLEKEVDDLIVSLLVETEDREALREQINTPAPRLFFGAIVQMIGFVLLALALAWAVFGIRMAQAMAQPASVLMVALLPLAVAVSVVGVGIMYSRHEQEYLRRLEQSKMRLRTLHEESRARSEQIEQVLKGKREQLERHKLLTSV